MFDEHTPRLTRNPFVAMCQSFSDLRNGENGSNACKIRFLFLVQFK